MIFAVFGDDVTWLKRPHDGIPSVMNAHVVGIRGWNYGMVDIIVLFSDPIRFGDDFYTVQFFKVVRV